jgi:GT2 family glycosyltransferase
MVNMAAFRAIQGFDPWYWQCESDIDLSLRFGRGGYIVAVDLGYTVCHEGAGGKTGGAKRTLDLYRARLHLYEHFYPGCWSYLRPLLWCRHLLETFYFFVSKHLLGKGSDAGLSLRITMLRTVFNGYNALNF